MQLDDGSFMGDEYGEIDTRFVFTAIQALSVLGKLSKVDTEKTSEWIKKCQNFDGGFGLIPGAESHAAQGKFFLHFLSQVHACDSFTLWFFLKKS